MDIKFTFKLVISRVEHGVSDEVEAYALARDYEDAVRRNWPDLASPGAGTMGPLDDVEVLVEVLP